MDLPGQYQLVEKKILPKVKKVFESGRYILGSEIKEFEDNFAKYCGVKYCVGTSSGTESLLLALRALDVGPGDEVITVPNTFTATAEAIVLVGAKPVFCDVDPKTMNMDPKSLKTKITKKTRAVIPVHLHGNPCDMSEIYKITKPKKIAVIEDAAQAHGAKYKGKKIGSLKSDFTAFSFHPVKNLGAFGDGGALVTFSKRLADKVRMLINHGRKGHHTHIIIGTTARLDTVQASILNIKLKFLDRWIKSKLELVKYYKKRLPKFCMTIQTTDNSESAHHVFAILVPNRDSLAKFLSQNGIETGMHYPIPLHMQPAYKFLGHRKGAFLVAEYYASHTLSLPLFPHMTKSQVDDVIKKIKEFYRYEK